MDGAEESTGCDELLKVVELDDLLRNKPNWNAYIFGVGQVRPQVKVSQIDGRELGILRNHTIEQNL
jgi:hypothetical protein